MSQAWWHRPLRIYQPNLRLIDGDQDARSIIRQAEDLSANAIVVNAGGAFAFYSTDLDCQERVPSLSGDLFGEIVSEGHARDIRVIARIEVSVKPRSVYDIHPEWCYVDAEGSPLDARGECPKTHTVICDGWCCEKHFTCGATTQCCIPLHHGDECPPESCAYCPVQYPDCVGWSGSNYTCCVESAIRCNVGDDVWCCDVWESCGTKVGHCTTG